MLRLLVGCVSLAVLAPGCGDDGDDDDDTSAVDGGVDGGVPGVCPFRPTVDECRVLGGEPGAGACEAGEACYWLIPAPCASNEDCRPGTTCLPYAPESTDVCQEDLDADGVVEPAAQAFCEPVRDAGQLGEACDRFDDCGDGLTCVEGVCRAYCCDPRDCEVGAELCLFNIEQRGEALGGRIGVCTACQGCALAPNGGCDAGEGCYLVDQCAVCLPAGALAEGAECASANDCAPGLACVRAAGGEPFRCHPLCDDGAPCATGARCRTGLVTADPALGVCVPR